MSKFLESLVRSEEKSCAGKVKYPREDSAQRAVQSMMKKKPDEVFEHYSCDYCDSFHIGHQTNFDWIPESHVSYTLMVNRWLCLKCTNFFFTNTVLSNRILARFPSIMGADENNVLCPTCRASEIEALALYERKFVSLKDIPNDSTETIGSLWSRF